MIGSCWRRNGPPSQKRIACYLKQWPILFCMSLVGVNPRSLPAQTITDPVLHIYSQSDKADIPRDPNGFLFNPRWFGSGGHPAPAIERRCRFRVVTSHLERRTLVVTDHHCLSSDERRLVTLNEPPQTLGLGVVCVTGAKTGLVRGHINWFPITATGQLRWNSFSAGAGDHDVNTDFLTRVPNATTSGNDRAPLKEFLQQRMYHLEFYSHETLERIPATAPGFWSALKRDLVNKSAAQALVDNRFAIVSGVYGLDGVHGFQAELHPVFAMAVLIKNESLPDTLREEWAVMVRNLGSEGDCAYGTLPLLTSEPTSPYQDFVTDLGKVVGDMPPRARIKESWSSDSAFSPTVETAAVEAGKERHVYLHFAHRRPLPGGKDFTFMGTVVIDWHPPAGYKTETERFPLASGKECPRERELVIERLAEWFPNYCHPDPNLSEIPKATAARGDMEQDPTENSGVAAPDPLAPLPEKPLQVLTPMPHVQEPRTYAEYAWPLRDSVSRCCFESTVSEPLSLNARRLVVGAGGPTLRRSSPIVGVFLYPHSSHYPGEGGAADFFNSFTYLGYRADLRRDDFYPITKKDTVTHYGPRRSGYALRISPFLSPNTVQLSDNFALMPYTAASIGLSYFKEDQFQWTWGWGLGLQAQMQSTDVFVEIQNSIRAGGYVNRWTYSTGILLPFGR